MIKLSVFQGALNKAATAKPKITSTGNKRLLGILTVLKERVGNRLTIKVPAKSIKKALKKGLEKKELSKAKERVKGKRAIIALAGAGTPVKNFPDQIGRSGWRLEILNLASLNPIHTAKKRQVAQPKPCQSFNAKI